MATPAPPLRHGAQHQPPAPPLRRGPYLSGRLRARLDDAAKRGETVDIGQVFASYTLDVTSMLAFGRDLDAQRGEDTELQLHIQRAFRMLSFRLFFPLRYWRFVSLPADRRLARSVEYLRAAVLGFIAEARERMARRPLLFEEPENFLEAKSAMATIARGFELELDPGAGEVRERLAFMVVPEGLRIKLRPRRPR